MLPFIDPSGQKRKKWPKEKLFFLEIFADALQQLIFLVHKGVSRHIQLFSTGALGQPVSQNHKNLIAFRVGIPQFGKKVVQDHTVDADFCGHGLIGKEAISCAVLLRNFHLAIDGKVLGCILGNTAILTFLTQAIALVAFLIRNAAGACSLLRFAGCADEAFPILFFLQGDFNPLMECGSDQRQFGWFFSFFLLNENTPF